MVETASRLHTVFGSLGDYQKGSVELVSGSVKEYAFSNVFDVAAKAKPYEKIVVGKNLEYVIEAVRAEGTSPWYACAHDEFVIVMDGKMQIDFVKLDDPASAAPENTEGTVLVAGEPKGEKMGLVRVARGHQALLPAGAAYRFSAAEPAVFLQQTILGPLSQERWGEICLR
ncbi:MAG TPA: hypothetical protein VMD91_16745 [Candidatus Sulfotelmatobacter sp.]|nr:hypothetical protein [Candidatus Sulfotelmatobacter sp.]